MFFILNYFFTLHHSIDTLNSFGLFSEIKIPNDDSFLIGNGFRERFPILSQLGLATVDLRYDESRERIHQNFKGVKGGSADGEGFPDGDQSRIVPNETVNRRSLKRCNSSI